MVGRNLDDISDNELINLIRKDDASAFTLLFERHRKDLLDSAYKVLRDKDVSQDIVQEVFTQLWNKRVDLSIEKVPSYLHQATRFAVFRHIRNEKPIISGFNFVHSNFEINNTEEQLVFDELSGLLEESINRLPVQCRRVFRLSRYEHLSNKEIADRLNISVRTVENHIAKALEMLRTGYR